jgi:hypothetical protein
MIVLFGSKARVDVDICAGTNLQALINYTKDASLNASAEIVLVLSNVADVQGLKRAEAAGIACKVFITHLCAWFVNLQLSSGVRLPR